MRRIKHTHAYKTTGKDGRNYYFNRAGRRIKKSVFFKGLRQQKKVKRGRIRKRKVQELVGWESRATWEAWLESRFPGIELYDPPPQFLQNVLPVERSYFLSRKKKFPPKEGSYILLAIWYVVYHVEDETYFLWNRIVSLAPSLREDMLYRKAEELFEDIEKRLGEKYGYIEVRDWVGFAADTERKFGRGRARGKKRNRRSKTSKIRNRVQSSRISKKV